MDPSQLQSVLRRLRLSGMASALPARLRSAARLSHAEFLALALADEVRVRRQRKLSRQVRAAGLLGSKSLAEFDWTAVPTLPRQAIEELAAGQFVREGKNALFLGPMPGKTYLAHAIALEVIKQDLSVLYRRLYDISDEINLAETALQRELSLQAFMVPDLLIIEADNWSSSSPYIMDYLLEVITRRGAKSILLISRRPLNDWCAFFRDLPAADHVLGRFISRSTLIVFDCPYARPYNYNTWTDPEAIDPSQTLLPLVSTTMPMPRSTP